MPTTTVKSIGTTGRDYSTLQAWEDACPADLTATDEIWKGECYNDSEFTGCLIISGQTTDATRYVWLTAAANQSFQDHASVRTNALTYDQTKGVGLAANTASTHGIAVYPDFTRVERLQVKQAQVAQALRLTTDGTQNNGSLVKDCIFRQNAFSQWTVYSATADNDTNFVNCLIHAAGSGAQGYANVAGDGANLINCTIVASNSGDAGVWNNSSTQPIIKNCAVFGFSTMFTETTAWSASSGYNCTSAASAPGSNNQVSKTFANQFESTTADFRAKAGADLIGTGNTDATYAPNDISATVRGATTEGDIGAWEYSAGGTSIMPTTGSLVLIGAAPTCTDSTIVITPPTASLVITGQAPSDTQLLSSAAFSEWLDQGSRCVLIEIDYIYQVGSGGSAVPTTGTIGFATLPYRTIATDTPASLTYLDNVQSIPSFARRINRETLGGRFQSSYGTLELGNGDRSIDWMLDIIQDGCDARFYLGDVSWARSEFRLIFTATQGKVFAPSADRITVEMLDRSNLLDVSMSGDVVGGSGNNAKRERLLIYGNPLNVEPIVKDSTNLVYDWCGNWRAGAVIDGIRDNGVELFCRDSVLTSGFLLADSATDQISAGGFGSLVSDLAVNEVWTFNTGSGVLPGGIANGDQLWLVTVGAGSPPAYAKFSATKGGSSIDITSNGTNGWTGVRSSFYDHADGTFTLSNSPAGRITIDPNNIGTENIQTFPTIAEEIFVNDLGQSAANFVDNTALIVSLNPSMGLVVAERTNALDVFDQLALSAAAFYGFTRENKFTFNQIVTGAIPGTSQMTFYRDDIKRGSLRADRLTVAYKSVRAIYDKNWTQQDTVSSSVTPAYASYYKSTGLRYWVQANTGAHNYSSRPWLYHKTMVDSQLFETLIKGASSTVDWTTRIQENFWPVVEFIDFETTLDAYTIELGDKVTTSFDDVAGLSAEYIPSPWYDLTGSIDWQVLAIAIDLSGAIKLTLVRRRVIDATVVI